MISFIVIGRNEGWKLVLCLDSVIDTTKKNHIDDFEILYIDSLSTDDSVSIAKGYDKIRVFEITGKCSAAIARNIGAKEANGNILVFLDGDMKLNADFLCMAISENEKLIYPYLTGIYNHCHYNNHNTVIKERALNLANNEFIKVTGGFFIITKMLWQKVGGMDNRLDRNEDIDLGLRLCKINVPPLMLAKVCINHYTSDNKMITDLLKYAFYYRYPSVLTRKHLLNIHYLPMFLRMNYTSIFLFVAIFFSFVDYYCILLYVLLILIRAFANQANRNVVMILHYLLRDVVFLFSFFTYYPGKSKVSYKECFVNRTSI